KQYGLDSEVRYRDALDNSQISDTMKVPISVTASGGMGALLTSPIVLAIIAIIVIGGGYYLYRRRKTSA
ncbi:MAG: LPXTG cell wall anchor domain-containing protein, partial [Methanospirillum sp.]